MSLPRKPKPIKLPKPIEKKKVTKPPRVKPPKPVKKRKPKKPREAKDVGTSKAEKQFMEWLFSIGVKVTEQHKIGYKFFDFIVEGTRILIEFDGDFYHCNPEVYKDGPINKMQKKAIANDRYKNFLASTAGYYLIRVWERDFNKNISEVKDRVLKFVEEHKDKESKPRAVIFKD